jgi:hypothetical protein
VPAQCGQPLYVNSGFEGNYAFQVNIGTVGNPVNFT